MGTLSPGRLCVGRGRTFSCYFYTLTAPPGHERRSCVGKVLQGEDWEDMGAERRGSIFWASACGPKGT